MENVFSISLTVVHTKLIMLKVRNKDMGSKVMITRLFMKENLKMINDLAKVL